MKSLSGASGFGALNPLVCGTAITAHKSLFKKPYLRLLHFYDSY